MSSLDSWISEVLEFSGIIQGKLLVNLQNEEETGSFRLQTRSNDNEISLYLILLITNQDFNSIKQRNKFDLIKLIITKPYDSFHMNLRYSFSRDILLPRKGTRRAHYFESLQFAVQRNSSSTPQDYQFANKMSSPLEPFGFVAIMGNLMDNVNTTDFQPSRRKCYPCAISQKAFTKLHFIPPFHQRTEAEYECGKLVPEYKSFHPWVRKSVQLYALLRTKSKGAM